MTTAEPEVDEQQSADSAGPVMAGSTGAPASYGAPITISAAIAIRGARRRLSRHRWEEIDLGDVAPVIELTKELIGAHLA
jgi:hypothetical protein